MGAKLTAESLKVREHILQKIKSQVRLYLGEESPAIRKYALSYKKDIERLRWKSSSKQEVWAAMEKAHMILGGDFHAYAQAQRVHLRHLRELTGSYKLILAVECVESRHQKILDAYIKGTVDEATFLKKVQWKTSWGFPWSHYKPLFEWLKQTGGRCVALNVKKPATLKGLRERDIHAAQILSQQFAKLKSGEKIYVLYGDLHVARKNLPSQVLRQTAKRCQMVTLYLNPEKIYFQLFKKNLENQVHVLRFSKNEFCLIESPPWVKWQSYLLFLEESKDFDLAEEDIDYSEHVLSLMQVLAMDIGFVFDKHVAISSFKDHDCLDLLAEILQNQDFQTAKQLIQNNMNFYDPRSQRGYLARTTVNYAAQLAGQIYHAQMCQLKSLSFDLANNFESQIWLDSVSFFLSKLINPHRKAPTMNDLKKQLAAFSPNDKGEKAFKLALDQKMHELELSYSILGESKKSSAKKSVDRMTYYHASQILGAMLGEKIYGVYKTGRLSRSLLHQWLKQSVQDVHFRKFYIQVLKEIDKLEAGEIHGI